MKALVIIDVQNDFLINGSLEVSSANDVIEPINEIIKNYTLVIATKQEVAKNIVSPTEVSLAMFYPHGYS